MTACLNINSFTSRSGQYDARHKSPPPEKIIRNANLHPRTVGQFDSTKKLCYAPNHKTLICKKSAKQTEEDRRKGDPIYFRYLALLSPYDSATIFKDHDIGLNVLVANMVSSLNRLNNAFMISPKMTAPYSTLNRDSGDVDILNYYNAFSSLVSFDKCMELHRSHDYVSYRVRHRLDRRYYFLKMGVHGGMTNEIKCLDQPNSDLLNDIKIIALVRHPNVVKYYTSWFEQRNFVLQLEYIVGESIYFFLYSTKKSERSEFKTLPLTNKLSELAAVKMINDVGSALLYLHEELGVVHNDVEPANVMIGYDPSLSVATDNDVETVRSMIYRSLLATRHPKGVTFKLTSFKHSFRFGDSAAIMHLSEYSAPTGLMDVETMTHEMWKRRDIFSLGMTVLHAMNGALNFPRQKIVKDHSCGFLDICSESLRNMLQAMVDSSKEVSLESLKSLSL